MGNRSAALAYTEQLTVWHFLLGTATLAVGQALAVVPLMRVLWWVHGHDEPDRLEVVLR